MRTELVIDTITDYVGTYYGFPYDQVRACALRDSLSSGQLRSKIAAAEILHAHTPGCQPFRGFFIGHWHGFLPRLLWRLGVVESGDGIELDSSWVEFSNRLNQDWKWSSRQADINDSGHDLRPYNLVVNTSCEHMGDQWLKLPEPNSWVLAQSTDYQHETHVNTCQTLDQFANKFAGYHIVKAREDQYNVYRRFTVLALKYPQGHEE